MNEDILFDFDAWLDNKTLISTPFEFTDINTIKYLHEEGYFIGYMNHATCILNGTPLVAISRKTKSIGDLIRLNDDCIPKVLFDLKYTVTNNPLENGWVIRYAPVENLEETE